MDPKLIYLNSDEPQWMGCECGLDTCTSCRAEKAALVFHTDDLHRAAGGAQTHHVADDSKADYTNVFSTAYDEARPLTSMVTLDAPHGSIKDYTFIYWFHPSISDSTLNGRTEFSYASPLIVYLFAYDFMLNPENLTRKELSKKVRDQVLDAIKKGNSQYNDLYPAQKKDLTPDETVAALPDLSLVVVKKYSTSLAIVKVIMDSIMKLRQNEILLIFRLKPYKVVSVMCTADPNAVCLFDSQLHRRATDQVGALLFYCKKDHSLLATMLRRFEEFCLTFQGQCDFILLTRT